MLRIVFYSFLTLQVFAASSVFAGMEEGTVAFDAGDYPQAYALWLVEAQAGNVDAQASVGKLYLEGRGVDQNLEEAVKWYRRAADQGSPVGLYMLGMMYTNGKGVAQDMEAGVQLVAQASDMGFAPAQATVMLFRAVGLDAPGTPMETKQPNGTVDDEAVWQKIKQRLSDQPPTP